VLLGPLSRTAHDSLGGDEAGLGKLTPGPFTRHKEPHAGAYTRALGKTEAAEAAARDGTARPNPRTPP